jgi:hypothetical protein
VIDEESVYLGKPLRDRLGRFVDPSLAEFVVNWQSAPRSAMPKSLWDGLTKEMEGLGQQIRAAIYARRGTPDSPPS